MFEIESLEPNAAPANLAYPNKEKLEMTFIDISYCSPSINDIGTNKNKIAEHMRYIGLSSMWIFSPPLKHKQAICMHTHHNLLYN